MPRIPLARALAAGLALVLLAGCTPATTPAGGTGPSADDLLPVFALATDEREARAWATVASELTQRARARLLPSTARAFASRETASPTDTSRHVDDLGEITEFADASTDIEDGVLRSHVVFGFDAVDATPPQGFRHESTTEIGICPTDGGEFVSGRWNLRHEQTKPTDEGALSRVEVTISADLRAVSAGGATFDATGIHLHVRRTDTTPDGRSVMVQGSIDLALPGVDEATWGKRFVDAIQKREYTVHSHYDWVRDEGIVYLLTPIMAIEVPSMVRQAQTELERGFPCGGWAMLPVEFTNAVLDPAGAIPELRRWSGHVCGDPLTSTWTFVEFADTFRGAHTEEHEIVPLAGDAPLEIFGVMPRLEQIDDPAPGAAPFRIAIEERWPPGVREVAHQRVYAEVVPAGDLCAP